MSNCRVGARLYIFVELILLIESTKNPPKSCRTKNFLEVFTEASKEIKLEIYYDETNTIAQYPTFRVS